ncbi:MAG: carotenoid biosynthesis protein [Spirochaetales bacterium]|nr:carotenoid biosynthesis protein [Spirochaetales bacterium]
MIFGTPVTWLIAEIFAIIVFFSCITHAAKQDKPAIKIFELFGMIVAAGLYENAGVAAGVYDYSLNRILLFGKVPIAILMFEAAIFYTAFRLTEHLKVPNWGRPFIIGLFAMIQDMTLDPAAVFDLYEIGSKISGRWNWAIHYEGGLFGIPYFNFSGWFYMMTYYAILISIGRWLYKKYNKKIIGYSYPVIAGILTPVIIVSPLTTFLLWAMPFFPQYGKTNELVMLLIHCIFALTLLVIYRGIERPLDVKKEWVILAVPIALHLYDIIMAFVLGIKIAYFPVLVIGGIHIAYLSYIYYISKHRYSPGS